MEYKKVRVYEILNASKHARTFIQFKYFPAQIAARRKGSCTTFLNATVVLPSHGHIIPRSRVHWAALKFEMDRSLEAKDMW